MTPAARLTPVPGRGSSPPAPPPARPTTLPSPTTATATVTVLFTDVIESTMILTSHGANRSDALRHSHFSALRRAVRHWRGEEIKTTGDGLMVVFRSALDAVECAVSMQRAVALLRRSDRDNPEVRVGLSAGEATDEAGDWYGQPVVEAARLCAVAAAGQILMTDVVTMLLGTRSSYTIARVGERELKGFVSPVAVNEVQWTEDVRARPLPPAVAAVDGAPFVGRAVERRRLGRAWERARAGQRGLLLLSGEPGIGKTRLAAELARDVHEEGGTILWGRTDENLEVAFQAFVDALRHYVAHTEPQEVLAQVGGGAPHLARLVPELADRLPELEVSSAGDGDADRLEMFEAVANLLNGASSSAPVLLVLDDLHWAASGSLLLLRHLARDRRPAHLLIVATYRDTDVDAFPAVTALLAELHREPHLEQVELGGLDSEDVAVLLEQLVGDDREERAGDDVAALVHTETEGNPFFVSQVIHHLSEVGGPGDGDVPAPDVRRDGFHRRPGADERPPSVLEEARALLVQATESLIGPSASRRTPRGPRGLGVPEGVRRVVGRRLSRLSEATNRLLKVAAVMGHEFELAVVEGVLGAESGPGAVLDAVEEALRARLVAELDGVPGRLTFTHQLVRQTLLDDLSAARRANLHRRVAEAIESLPGSADARVGSLAYHYSAGASAGAAERGAAWAERAGTAALEEGFYESAVVHLERALEALALTVTPDSEVRARLLVELAEAAYHIGDVGRSKATAASAAEAARGAGSPKLLARAAWWRAAFPMAGVEDPLTVELLEEGLEAIGDGDPRLRAGLLGQLALYLGVNQGELVLADATAAEAVESARVDGDATVLARALVARCEILQGSPDLELQSRLLEELAAILPHVPPRVRSGPEKLVLRNSAILLLQSGDVTGFEAGLAALADVKPDSGGWFDAATVAMWRSLRALMDGRLHEAEGWTHEMIRQAGEEANFRHTAAAQLYQLRREQGRLGELMEFLEAVVRRTPHLAGFRVALALASAELGDLPAARSQLSPLASDDLAAVPWDVTRSACLALLAETCSLLDETEHLGCLYEMLLPYEGQLVVVAWGAVCLGAADRYLGFAAALERRWDEAERHFEAALALEDGIGAAALSARTRCAYAAALSQRGRHEDRGRARTLLQAAADTADGLGAIGLASAVERAGAVGPVSSDPPRPDKEQ